MFGYVFYVHLRRVNIDDVDQAFTPFEIRFNGAPVSRDRDATRQEIYTAADSISNNCSPPLVLAPASVGAPLALGILDGAFAKSVAGYRWWSPALIYPHLRV